MQPYDAVLFLEYLAFSFMCTLQILPKFMKIKVGETYLNFETFTDIPTFFGKIVWFWHPVAMANTYNNVQITIYSLSAFS